jgi:hypothetical protein
MLPRPRLPGHPTCPTPRDSQALADMPHCAPPARRAHELPEAASFRIAMSSARSATKRFSRAFSRSSYFSRLAWSSRSPPYSLRQRS